jgi:hypothetical protein
MSNLVVKLISYHSIQEGMIFVSMSHSHLLTRTAQYQMRDPSPLQESGDLEPLYLNDVNESRPLSRRPDSNTQHTVPPPILNSATYDYRRNSIGSTECIAHPFPVLEVPNEIIPLTQTSALPELSDFTVTTTCNDPSSDEEEPSNPATLADRLRRDSLSSPYELSSDEDTEVGFEPAMRRARAPRPSSSRTNYSRRRAEPSKIEIVGAADVNGDETENKDVLAPHARFFIEKSRRCVT